MVDLVRSVVGGGAATTCSMLWPVMRVASDPLSESAAGDKVDDETGGESLVVVAVAAVAVDASGG